MIKRIKQIFNSIMGNKPRYRCYIDHPEWGEIDVTAYDGRKVEGARCELAYDPNGDLHALPRMTAADDRGTK